METSDHCKTGRNRKALRVGLRKQHKMKSLQIKVEYLTGMTEPQIQIGPYDISDPISRAIVSSLTLEAIRLLENQQRVTISNETQSTKTLTYKYN